MDDADRRTVLVVEDDEDIRETISGILEDAGYHVVTAAHGREALSYLRSGQPLPQLILLDLMMPVMNGWDFRFEQLNDSRIAHLPIVVLSGDAHVQDKAADLGAAGAVGKPISLDHLLELTAKYCSDSVPKRREL